MTATPPPDELPETRIARALAALLATIAVGVLSGWALHLEPLKRVAPGMASMNPVTAVLFLVLAPPLWMIASPGGRTARRPVVDAAAGLVLCVALAKLFDILVGTGISPDELLFRSQLAVAGGPASRMAPNTAASFLFSALALLAVDRVGSRRRLTATEALLVPAGALSLLSIVGHAYQTAGLIGGHFIPMALHTAISFQLFGIALLMARPDQGATAVVFERSELGRNIRAVLPTAVFGPLVLGGLTLWAERAQLIAPDMGISMLVLLLVFVLGLMILRASLSMHEVEVQRRRVDEMYAERRLADEAATEVTRALIQLTERLRPHFGDAPNAGRTILNEVLSFCRMPQGCLYWLPHSGDEELQVLACVAFGSSHQLQSRWKVGEGLPGQCAREKRLLLVKDVPRDYFRIRSGTLDALPALLVFAPVLAEGELVGVLELAGFAEPDEQSRRFLDAVSRPVAFALFRLREELRTSPRATPREELAAPT